MTSPTKVLKSVGPKLVPFFKSVAVYFVLFIPADRPSIWGACVKCAPIFSLVFFALLHGMSLGNEYVYSRRIIIGLLFSSIGDACLIWPQYFPHGMAAFGVAQVVYSSAYGFKPVNPILGLLLYAFGVGFVILLMPNLSGVLVFGLPIYTFLLVTMAWRAIARVQLFQDLWTWTKLCSCLGAILFMISDSLIAINQFYSPIPYSQALIMSTYYAGQLGIALSVVDSKDGYIAQVVLEAQKEKKESNEAETGEDTTADSVSNQARQRRSAIPIQ